MMRPTPKVRAQTLRRDERCLMCTSRIFLEWNHRQDSGMGGRGSKAPKVTPADGVMLCRECNQLIESDARKQADAIFWGYKVRKFSPVLPEFVPVWYRDVGWFKLNRDGTRDRLSPSDALAYKALAGLEPSMEEVK